MLKSVSNLTFITCLFLAVFLISCIESNSKNSADSEKDQTSAIKKKKELELYKDSELAVLMRKMHEEMKKAKITIESGEKVSISNYSEMLTAEPTDPKVKEPVFEAFANTYINLIDSFNNQKTNLHKLFNKSVDACISCHESYCQGPIEMIGKLRLEDYMK